MTRPARDAAARRRAFDDLCRALLAGDAEEAGLTRDELALLREFMDEEQLQALFDEAGRGIDDV